MPARFDGPRDHWSTTVHVCEQPGAANLIRYSPGAFRLRLEDAKECGMRIDANPQGVSRTT